MSDAKKQKPTHAASAPGGDLPTKGAAAGCDGEGSRRQRIYVASSWRNEYQPVVVRALRFAGHDVYDFRHPAEGNNGFHWSEIDPAWQQWTPQQYRAALRHPVALAGFASDMDALRWCDACVLVMPSGRSAHLEAGWAAGAGKRTAMLVLDPMEPELMVGMFDEIYTSIVDLLHAPGWAGSRCIDAQPEPGPQTRRDGLPPEAFAPAKKS